MVEQHAFSWEGLLQLNLLPSLQPISQMNQQLAIFISAVPIEFIILFCQSYLYIITCLTTPGCVGRLFSFFFPSVLDDDIMNQAFVLNEKAFFRIATIKAYSRVQRQEPLKYRDKLPSFKSSLRQVFWCFSSWSP